MGLEEYKAFQEYQNSKSNSSQKVAEPPLNAGLITKEKAAIYLSIGNTKLYELTRDGLIPSYHIGKSVRYRISDLDDYIEKIKCLPRLEVLRRRMRAA